MSGWTPTRGSSCRPKSWGALARGQIIRHRAGQGLSPGPDGLLRVVDDRGQLCAIARLDDGRLYPQKVFVSLATAGN